MAVAGTEIAVGYISITADTSKIAPSINKALGSSSIAKSGEKLGTKLSSGIAKTLKVGALSAGAAAGGVLATSLSKGFQRLDAIDQAQAKFKGLKLSAAESAQVMEDIGSAVKGTAFATSDAADASAMFLAAGIKPGKELADVLGTVADTASFAGKGFGEVASIFTKAKNAGKVMGDTLAQLGDNGIPAVSALSKELGISAEEVTNLASQGKISFDDLQRAMDSTLGGSALNAGQTFSGAMDNVGAALGRVGETILGGAFAAAPGMLASVTGQIDTVNDRLKGAMTLLSTGDFTGEIGEQLGGVEEDSAVVGALLAIRENAVSAGAAMQDFGAKASEAFKVGMTGDASQATLISPEMSQSIADFHDFTVDRIGSIRDNLSDVFSSIDFSALGGALGSIATAVGGISAQISAASWAAIVGVINAVTPILQNVLVPVLNDIAAFVQGNPGLVRAMVTAWLGFKTAGMAIKGVGSVMSGIKGKVTATKTAISELKSGASLAWSVLGEAKSAKGPIVGITTAITSSGTAAKVASGAQKGLSGAMRLLVGHPVIAAIAAIIGALVLFFTQTELGQQIWQGFVDFLGTAFEWVKGIAMTVWPYISDAIAAVGDVLQNVWTNFIQPVLGFISTAFQVLAGVVFAVIYGTILVAWNAMAALFQLAWTTIISPVWELMKLGLQALGSFFSWVWASVIKPAWDALGNGIRWVYDTVIKPVWELMKLGLQAVGDFFTWVWNSVIKPAWDALGAGIRWVYDTVIRPCWDALKLGLQAVGDFFTWVWNSVIKPAWDALGAGIEWVRVNIIDPSFNAIKTSLQAVGDFFGSIVDGIRTVWNELRSILAKPINFMINTVWNQGILKAWNTAADFLPGLNPGSPLSGIPEHATGGRISGPGSGTSDDVLMWGSNGEHMWTAEESRRVGGHGVMEAMRNMVATGREFTWNKGRLYLDGNNPNDNGPLKLALPAYKDGGAIEPEWKASLARGHEWARAQDGKPYLAGNQFPAGADCSGFMSALAGVILNGNSGAHWTTVAFPAGQAPSVNAAGQPWVAGLGEGMSIGMNGGPASGGQNGHTAGTLTGVKGFSTVNVESGGSNSRVKYGASDAAGADHPQFPTQYHLAIGADGAFEAAGGPSPEAKKGRLRKKVEEILQKAIQPALDAMPSGPPEWLDIPGGALQRFKDGTIEKLFDIIDNLGDLLSGAYNKAKDLGSGVIDGVTGLFRDQGGYIPNGMSIVRNETGKPEAVLNWEQLKHVKELVQAAANQAGVGSYVAQGISAAEMWANVPGNVQGNLAAISGGDYSSLSGDTGDGKGPVRWDLIGRQVASEARVEIGGELLGLLGITKNPLKPEDLVDDQGRREQRNASASAGYTAPTTGATVDIEVAPEGTSVAPAVSPTAGVETAPGYQAPGTRDITAAERAEYTVTDPELLTGGDGDVRSIVQGIFAGRGWTGSQWSDADFIINKESSWNPLARNPSSGAFGLFQFLGATKQQYLPDENPDPAVQGRAGAKYIGDRYGDPSSAASFWRANNWYDKGGIASGIGVMQKNTLQPERVLSPAQTASFDSLVKMLPSLLGTGAAGAVSAAGGAAATAATAAGFAPVAPLIAAATPALAGAASQAATAAGGAATRAATSAATAVASSVDDLRASIAADRAEARNSTTTAPDTGPVTININGATDPQAVAAEVQKALRNTRRASAAYTTV